MPGMDGFQAVQAIKADLLTATIPLLRYTSQEGELYVSQARALGAVGVLPKTVRPADVSRVLYQLHLLEDRRAQRSALFPGPAAAAARARETGQAQEAAAAAAIAAHSEAAGSEPGASDHVSTRPTVAPLGLPAAAELVDPHAGSAPQPRLSDLHDSLQQLVKDQLDEQRRFMHTTLEAFARRVSGEMRDGFAKLPPPLPPEIPAPPAAPRQWWPVVMTALMAVIPTLVLGYMTWHTSLTNDRLAHELVAARAEVEKTKADAQAAVAAASANATLASTQPVAIGAVTSGPMATELVPYGEAPFAGSRLDRLRSLAATLESQQFHGRIRVASFVGDFCLAGTGADGYAAAAADTLVSKCEFLGNPYDDSLSPAQRQSVDFANFAATLQRRTAGAIRVDVVNAGRDKPLAYPEQGEKTTAASWNEVAAKNNRVEFSVVPDA
jgi:CheY-like chemotaxis protein